MVSGHNLKIALAPIEIAGYYTSLARGFAELGVDCELLLLHSHRFGYDRTDPDGALVRGALEVARYCNRFGPRHPARVLRLTARTAVLAHVIRTADVIVFGAGESLLDHADLPLLKHLGKTLVFVFHGSDSRPPYLNGKSVRKFGDGAGLIRATRRTRRRLDWIGRYADVIVDSPLSGQLHGRPFVNWFRIGLPCAVDPAPTPPHEAGRRPLRVVHAPSDPESKGTPLIEAAIERARARGIELVLVRLIGRPNAEVHEELERCDFVIDELYSDVPGAGLAMEAASHARPSIVGGYAATQFERWIEPDMMLPTHYCLPSELDDAIDRLAIDSAYRLELGRRAHAFVAKQCSPAAVAQRLLRTISSPGDTRDWLVDPTRIDYVHGTGLSAASVRVAIRMALEAGSERALRVSDKPELLRRLVALANESDEC